MHLLPVRVYYEDTDFSGIVYHASYLRFLERGRTEHLRASGFDQSALHREGLIFAVRRMTIDWLKPARMDDRIVVETVLRDIRGASLVIDQRIARDDDILLRAEVLIAALKDGTPSRIADDVRRLLTPLTLD